MKEKHSKEILKLLERVEDNKLEDAKRYLSKMIASDGKVGRKGKYDTHVQPFLIEIENNLSKGMTKGKICDQLNVSIQAFVKYQKEHPELAEAVERGKVGQLELVEGALFKSAVGYKEMLKDVKVLSDGEIVNYVKEHRSHPNISAIKFYLINISPDKWASKFNIEVSSIDEFFEESDE